MQFKHVEASTAMNKKFHCCL